MTQHADDVSAFDPSLIELDVPAPTARQAIPVVKPAKIPHSICKGCNTARPTSTFTATAVGQRCGVCLPKAHVAPMAARQHVSGCSLAPTHDGVCYARPTMQQRQAIPVARTEQSEAIGASLGVQQLGATRSVRGPSLADEMRTLRHMLAERDAKIEKLEGRGLTAGNLIAGAAAESHGALVSFSGLGTMTRSTMLATLTGAGFPASWCRSIKSAHAHAGDVVGGLNTLGYVARAARSGEARNEAKAKGMPLPTWDARWEIQRTRVGGVVGERAGTIVCTVELYGTELRIANDAKHAHVAAGIREKFTALVAAETYTATDVSSWLKGVLVHQFRAVQIGGGWYVKREHVAAATKLITACKATGWGTGFFLPPLPVATSAELRENIAASFGSEVDDVLSQYREAKAEAGKAGLSSRSSLTHHGKLRALTERCIGFAALLGPEYVETMRAKLVTASEEIEQTIDGMSLRFGAIFDELRRDAERGAK
jgi:hypothetical protein